MSLLSNRIEERAGPHVGYRCNDVDWPATMRARQWRQRWRPAPQSGSLVTDSTVSHSWAGYFPMGCPPNEASDANGVVIRLVQNNPPAPSDFKSHYELSPNKDWGDRLCKACGLSVYGDRTDAKRIMAQVPALRNRLLATGELEPEFGKVLPTPSRRSRTPSHGTWWLSQGVEPWKSFSVLPQDSER
jgi:hypothetical protein